MTTPIVTRTKSMPYRQGLPLLGSLSAYNRDRLDFCMRVFYLYGDRCRFHLGPYPTVLLSSADDVQRVLSEQASAFGISKIVRRAFRPLAANGLLTSQGEFHRRQRKLMAPHFQPRHIAGYAATMAHYAEQLQQAWCDGETIDIDHEMTRVTMSIIGKVLFDAEVFTETDELGGAMKTALDHINLALASPIPLLFVSRQTSRALALLRRRMQQMVDARRANAQKKEDLLSRLLCARDEDGERSRPPSGVPVETRLAAPDRHTAGGPATFASEDGKSMSDQQLVDECLTVFFAGHETIASALSWTWYLLCQHPEIYRRVQREVENTLQGRSPTVADLERLPYCLQVFKEALRLYPPIHAIVRVARQDVALGEYLLRKGDTILISPYVLHHRADYFSDPEVFDPDRFTPANEKRLPRLAFLPFGAGPRTCIGSHFALMEGHLLIATLAQRCTFELVPGQHVVADPKVTLRPRDGVEVVVREKKGEEPL